MAVTMKNIYYLGFFYFFVCTYSTFDLFINYIKVCINRNRKPVLMN
jgi:hypothetical protein